MRMRSLQLLEEAHQEMTSTLGTLRALDLSPELLVRTLANVYPQITAVIESHLPIADAVILTPERVRELLARFAIDLLEVQVCEILALGQALNGKDGDDVR